MDWFRLKRVWDDVHCVMADAEDVTDEELAALGKTLRLITRMQVAAKKRLPCGSAWAYNDFKRIYVTELGYAAASDGGWLDGTFDTLEAAEAALGVSAKDRFELEQQVP